MRSHWGLLGNEHKQNMLYRLMRLKRKSHFIKMNFWDRLKVVKIEMHYFRHSKRGSKRHNYLIIMRYLLPRF